MIGFGYDSHRLSSNETLIIGGMKIASDIGTLAHSDGDALLHALCDALLGATALGDIGEHFPDTDPQYKNADSSDFLKEIMKLMREKSVVIVNIDATVVLEKPKLSPYKESIRNNIAELCSISPEKVNIKAKTNEKMGFTGRSEGICVYCVVQVE